jgi:hypothetical protein
MIDTDTAADASRQAINTVFCLNFMCSPMLRNLHALVAVVQFSTDKNNLQQFIAKNCTLM